MLNGLYRNMGTGAVIILCLAIILLTGFFLTRITRLLKLPNVTAYIFAGIIIGPYALNLVPVSVINGMGFMTDIALAFIAFGVGRFFKLSTLKKSGLSIIVITVFEALIAAVLVTAGMYFIFRLPITLCLLLGAIGSATAPASTIMTIRQYRAKGEFVDAVLQVVALDDAVSLLAFSVCAAIVNVMESGEGFDSWSIISPLVYNIALIGLGIALGFVLHLMIGSKRSRDNRLIIVCAIIFFLTAVCSALNVSPLLSCMCLGAAYINVSGNKELFDQINDFTPPVMCMFFVLSGMKLNIPGLSTVGIVGAGYFVIRIIGKYVGAFLGALTTKKDKKTRNCLGLALIPQAGVAIGLAALGERILGGSTGATLSTIILASSVIYEMVGPASAKLSLTLAGVIGKTSPVAADANPAEQPSALAVPEETPLFAAQPVTVMPPADEIDFPLAGLPLESPALYSTDVNEKKNFLSDYVPKDLFSASDGFTAFEIAGQPSGQSKLLKSRHEGDDNYKH